MPDHCHLSLYIYGHAEVASGVMLHLVSNSHSRSVPTPHTEIWLRRSLDDEFDGRTSPKCVYVGTMAFN